MCQNPKDPDPNPSNREEQGRDLRKQEQVQELSLELSNGDPSARIEAARDIRKLARASARARSALGVSSVVDPLVSMLSSLDRHAKESALLALLTLAVRNERNKELILKSGAIPHLIELLKSKNTDLRDLATAAILTLSASISNRPIITASGAVPLLIQTLVSGSIQSRVDAVTALYNLSNSKENPNLNLSIEATYPLLTLLKDSKKYSQFADKVTALLEIISKSDEGMLAISKMDNAILTLVETIEEGSIISTEHAIGILLELCMACREKYREMILKEGPIPGLLLLTVEGSKIAQHKARILLELLRGDECSVKDLETIVYSIATRVDGPKKAEKTAKKLLRDMVRRNMELNLMRIQNRAVSGTSSKPVT